MTPFRPAGLAPVFRLIRHRLRLGGAARPANGLDQPCVISCDNIVTVPARTLGRPIGFLLPGQEAALTAAIQAAFDLD